MRGADTVKEIQIKNFRSLKDTGLQTVAPITLLVGENSSGKSTFLRAFPLFKQSISKRTSGPILWAGDIDDYVDFGSFDETVTNDGSEAISFRYKFDISKFELLNSSMMYTTTSSRLSTRKTVAIDYEIAVSNTAGRDLVSAFNLRIDSLYFSFDLLHGSVDVENELFYRNPFYEEEPSDEKVYSHFRWAAVKSGSFGFDLPSISERWEELSELMKLNRHEDFSTYQLNEFVLSIGEKYLHNGKTAEFTAKEIEERPNWFAELYEQYLYIKGNNFDCNIDGLLKLCFAYRVFPYIDEYITRYFNQVHYIAPLRATAERYYRLRNLAIDEIDYQGKNLAIFINSLSRQQLSNFNAWTKESSGFSVFTDKSKGHLSLLVKLENSEKAINLSDSGFGYSQVLPIITQLWELSTRTKAPRRRNLLPLVVAIEQPELHLHPAVQAKLAKAFVASVNLARKNGFQLQLILETHSETIVNALGRAIARGNLKARDVSVILFEKEPNGISKIQNSKFDSDGYLIDWPYGFFDSGE